MRSLALYSIAFIFEGNGFQLKKTGEMMNEGEKTGELKHAMSQKACCDEGEKKPCCEEHKALPRGPAREPPSERGEGPSTKSELNTPNESTKYSKKPHAHKGRKSENVREAIDAQAKTGKKGDGKTGKQAAEHVGEAEQPVKPQAGKWAYWKSLLLNRNSLIAAGVFALFGGVLAYVLSKHGDSAQLQEIYKKISIDKHQQKHVVPAVMCILLAACKIVVCKLMKMTVTLYQEIVNIVLQGLAYLVSYFAVYKGLENEESAKSAFTELSQKTESANIDSDSFMKGGSSAGISSLMPPFGIDSSTTRGANSSMSLANEDLLGPSAGPVSRLSSAMAPADQDSVTSSAVPSVGQFPMKSSASDTPGTPPAAAGEVSVTSATDENSRFPTEGGMQTTSLVPPSRALDARYNPWATDEHNVPSMSPPHSSFMETISSISLTGSSVQNNMRMRSRETIVQIV